MNQFVQQIIHNQVDPMVQVVENHCEKVNLPIFTVFETAYMWRFGKTINIDNEVRRYRQHGIVPCYIIEYISHVELHNDRDRAI